MNRKYPETGIAPTRYWHSLEDGRVQYTLSRWNLDANGCCKNCGTRCSGVFDTAPGTWGSRRLPVRLKDFALSAS